MINKYVTVESPDDEVVKFQNGDRKAFDRIVLRHRDSVFNLCFRMLGDYDEANDCAQETFIKVYNNIRDFKHKSAFSTWLYRIAVNTCRNHLTSFSYRMKQKMIRLNHNDREGDSVTIDIGDKLSDPSRIYELKENEAIIQKAIGSLNAIQRALVVLRDIEGKSYEEIGEITGLKQGTVKSKLARARQDLRALLKGVI